MATAEADGVKPAHHPCQCPQEPLLRGWLFSLQERTGTHFGSGLGFFRPLETMPQATHLGLRSASTGLPEGKKGHAIRQGSPLHSRRFPCFANLRIPLALVRLGFGHRIGTIPHHEGVCRMPWGNAVPSPAQRQGKGGNAGLRQRQSPSQVRAEGLQHSPSFFCSCPCVWAEGRKVSWAMARPSP